VGALLEVGLAKVDPANKKASKNVTPWINVDEVVQLHIISVMPRLRPEGGQKTATPPTRAIGTSKTLETLGGRIHPSSSHD
jgi:hypothetical protein